MVLILFYFGCKEEKKVESVDPINSEAKSNTQSNNILQIGKDIKPIKIDFSDVAEPVVLETQWDSIFQTRPNFQDFFFDSKDTFSLIWSTAFNQLLTYDPWTSSNCLYTSDGQLLGNIKIQANNPEFYNVTKPFDQEPSLLHIDNVAAVTKYTIENDEFVEKWKIDLKQNESSERQYWKSGFFIDEKSKRLIVVFMDHEDNAKHLNLYSLENGLLEEEILTEHDKNTIQFFYKSGFLIRIKKDELIIRDLEYNENYSVKVKEYAPLVELTKIDNTIYGVYSLGGENIMHLIEISNGEVKDVSITMDSIYSLSQVVIVGKKLAIMYVQVSTPNTITPQNQSKLISQGIYVYDFIVKDWFHIRNIKTNSNNDFKGIVEINEELITGNTSNSISKINFQKLE